MYNIKQQSRSLKRGFLNENRTRRFVISLAKQLWISLGTPLCVGLYALAESGDWDQIIDHKLDPLAYNDPAQFQKDYAAVNFIRKYPSLPIRIDRKANAMQKFRESEQACRDTNSLILAYRRRLLTPKKAEVDTVISRARSKIAYVLGTLILDELSEEMRWGPGVTSKTTFGLTSAYNKFDVGPECTSNCVHHAWAAINSSPSWVEHLRANLNWPVDAQSTIIPLVRGNRVTTVPKDARIDRIIAVEPHMNIYVQLGFGSMIRSRLKRVGVDLDFGQAENASLALKGAREGTLATVDLSSASDTISYELVRLLLPEDWFYHLEACRSRQFRTSREGEWETYSKFSSMGNGYTFELESLIFWAISSACIAVVADDATDLRVYGDDIVLPCSAYPLLVETLSFLGFSVNKRKSFSTSLFRESCGAHFFGSLDVKPVYVDKALRTQVELNALHNQLVLLAERLVDRSAMLGIMCEVRQMIVEFTPPHNRFFIPKGSGDGGFIGFADEVAHNQFPIGHGHQGFFVKALVPVLKKQSCSGIPLLIWKLYDHTRRSSHDAWVRETSLERLPIREYALRVRDSLRRKPISQHGEKVIVRGAVQQFRTQLVRCFRPQYVGDQA